MTETENETKEIDNGLQRVALFFTLFIEWHSDWTSVLSGAVIASVTLS